MSKRSQKQQQVYRYLRGIGYSSAEANKLKGRTSLSETAARQNDTKAEKQKAVYRYYRQQGLNSKEASRRSGRTKSVWKDHVKYLQDNAREIRAGKIKKPEIPKGLAAAGVELYANEIRFLAGKRKGDEILKQFGALKPEKVEQHIIRLKAFQKKMPPEAIDEFLKTLKKAKDIDDYYAAMEKASSKITRVR